MILHLSQANIYQYQLDASWLYSNNAFHKDAGRLHDGSVLQFRGLRVVSLNRGSHIFVY